MRASHLVPARHLVLVGLMGAGKTAVGELCAARLGRSFVDSDDLVEAAAGMTIAEIFDADGETGFRRRECEAIVTASALAEASVLATGGGAVLDGENRRALRAGGVVVWLRADPEVLAARVAGARPNAERHRPLLGGDPVATLRRLAADRAGSYEASAHLTIDTDGRTVTEVTDAVLAAYESAGGEPCTG